MRNEVQIARAETATISFVCTQLMLGGAHPIDQDQRRINRQAAQRDA
jgi:hypothetical protein